MPSLRGKEEELKKKKKEYEENFDAQYDDWQDTFEDRFSKVGKYAEQANEKLEQGAELLDKFRQEGVDKEALASMMEEVAEGLESKFQDQLKQNGMSNEDTMEEEMKKQFDDYQLAQDQISKEVDELKQKDNIDWEAIENKEREGQKQSEEKSNELEQQKEDLEAELEVLDDMIAMLETVAKMLIAMGLMTTPFGTKMVMAGTAMLGLADRLKGKRKNTEKKLSTCKTNLKKAEEDAKKHCDLAEEAKERKENPTEV